MSALAAVMIIRHAEKPPDGHESPFGVTAGGEQDTESLIVRGWQRAGALATLFAPLNGTFVHPGLATPTTIYASQTRADSPPEGKDTGSKSKRPLQTVMPLASKLHLAVNLSFGKGEEKNLASDVLTRSGVVLISWQHEKICEIARHLVKSAPPQQQIPSAWPEERFDVVWVFTPIGGGAHGSWAFTQVPQALLDRDLRTVIS